MTQPSLSMSSLSPRQVAQRALWDSDVPARALDVMASQRAARDPEMIAVLEADAANVAHWNEPLAERLTEIAALLSIVHRLAEALSAVSDMESLLDWYKHSSVSYTGDVKRVLLAMMVDARREGRIELGEALRRALRLRVRLTRVFALAQRMPQMSGEQMIAVLDDNPLLCQDALHEWIRRWGRSQSKDHIAYALQLVEFLKSRCTLRRAIRELESAVPDDRGMVPVRQPISPEQAALWYFMGDDDLIAEFQRRADEIASGQVSLRSALAALATNPPWKDEPPRAAERAVAASYLLQHLLLVAPAALVPQVIAEYRALLDDPELKQVDERVWPTNVLHYVQVLRDYWQLLGTPRAALTEAVDLVSEALRPLDHHRSPRLAQDLLLMRARTRENLAVWDRAQLEFARDDYVAGLSVKEARHEREARGAALSDLANVTQQLPFSDAGERDARIVALFDEAVACVSRPNLRRAAVLANYAIYLNERSIGDWRANQERAYALVIEARDLFEAETAAGIPLPAVEMCGSIYVALGNIVRARPYPQGSRLDAARDAFETGLRRLQPFHHPRLRGLLRLGLGQTFLSMYRSAGRAIDRDKALYALDEAVEDLADAPTFRAIAEIERCFAACLSESPPAPEAFDIAIETVRKSAAELEASSGPRQLRRAAEVTGRLLLARSQSTGRELLDEALLWFGKYAGAARALGDLEDLCDACGYLAEVCVLLWRLSGDKAQLRAAREHLLAAVDAVSQLRLKSRSIAWRAQAGQLLADLLADLTWVRAELEEDWKLVWFEATRSKGDELTDHLFRLDAMGRRTAESASHLDELRRRAHGVDVYWSGIAAQREGGANLGVQLVDDEAVLERLANDRAMLEGDQREAAAPEGFAAMISERFAGRAVAILDFTISRFGSVVFCGRAAAPRMKRLSFRRSDLDRLLAGTESAPGWLALYDAYRSSERTARPQALARWAASTRALLDEITGRLLQPLGEGTEELSAPELVISPGALVGLPLHAAPNAANEPLSANYRRVAYLPSLFASASTPRVPAPPKRALCFLCDPARQHKEQLRESPAEVAAAAASLLAMGAEVDVVATVGEDVGGAVFRERGLALPGAARILEVRATAEWLRQHLSEYDHVLYSGHGTERGLCLVNEAGDEEVFPSIGLLEFPALTHGPTIYLSACETAYEGGRSADWFSVASFLLRLGAGVVVATLWVVRDSVSRAFSAAWYRALAMEPEPGAAMAAAIQELRKDVSLGITDLSAFVAVSRS